MIIERYVRKELAKVLATGTFVLVLINASAMFTRYIGQAASGYISSAFIGKILVLKTVESFSSLLPLGVYLSVLWVMHRLHASSELVAMTAAGVSPIRLARTVLEVSVVAALLVSFVSLGIGPWVTQLKETTRSQAKQMAARSALGSGRFQRYGDGAGVIYAEALDGDDLRGVFIEHDSTSGAIVLASRRGILRTDGETGDEWLVLESGHRYEGVPGHVDFVVTEFESFGVRLDPGPLLSPGAEVDMLPTWELLRATDSARRTELHWRLSGPISTVLLGMLALPLARSFSGEHGVAKAFRGLLVYFVYTNMLAIGRTLAEREIVPPAAGSWPLHALLAIVVVALIFAQTSGLPRSARGRILSRSRPLRHIPLH